MIVIHSGKNKDGSIDKKVLIESKQIANKNMSIEDLAKIIKSKINQWYEYKELIIIGDGARWMKHLAKLLNGHFILDHFHWKKLVQQVIGYKKYKTQNKIQFQHLKEKYGMTFYKYITSLIENNLIDETINILKQTVNNTNLLPSKKMEIQKLANYLSRNKLSFHFGKNYYIGSRTEAFVNNLIKQKWKIKYSIFAFDTFKLLLKSKENEKLQYFFI